MSSQEGAANERQQLNFSCHCGAIKVSVPRHPAPEYINECMCSNCRKHGAAFVYYLADQATITKNGPTKGYRWAQEVAEYTWCDACGCLMYWCRTEKYLGDVKSIGINSRCIDDLEDLKHVERRVTWDVAQEVLDGVYDAKGPVRK